MFLYDSVKKLVILDNGEEVSLFCGEDLDELSYMILSYTEKSLTLQEFYSMLLKWKLEG